MLKKMTIDQLRNLFLNKAPKIIILSLQQKENLIALVDELSLLANSSTDKTLSLRLNKGIGFVKDYICTFDIAKDCIIVDTYIWEISPMKISAMPRHFHGCIPKAYEIIFNTYNNLYL